MLKLIKYDIMQNYHIYVVEYAIYLILCLVLPFLPNNLSAIVSMFMVFFVTIVILFNIGTIIYNYYQSMFGKQAYLTLTLPYNSHELFASKVLAAFLWIMISVLVLLFGVAIITIIMGFQYADIQEFFELVRLSSDIFIAFFISADFLQAILVMFISILAFVITGFTLCTVVQTKYTRKNKMMWLVGIFFVASMIYNYLHIVIANTNWYQQMYYMLQGALGFWLTESLGSLIWLIIAYFINVYILEHMVEIQ